MCEFCESILNSSKKVNWAVRSTFADDNITELINDEKNIKEDFSEFEMYGYIHEGKSFFGIGYRHEIVTEDNINIIISPFSETIQINYCPVCGQQISEKLISPDEYLDRYRYYISIQEK